MSHDSHDKLNFERAVVSCLMRVMNATDLTLKFVEDMMLDTKKLLDAVAREKTDIASLLALNAAQITAMQSIQSQLDDVNQKLTAALAQAAAIPAPMEPLPDQAKAISDLQAQLAAAQSGMDAAQADIDSAVSDLSAGSSAAETALKANVAPVAPAAASTAPAATTAAPQPLPGTGTTDAIPAAAASPTASQPAPAVDPAAPSLTSADEAFKASQVPST